ncbi:MAG: aromatic ring-hydroxylating dioxygenase subunit alpha [Alphaproteobacteria bacterium]|nr:aromatic ring-hydroxylating dioxygenase subunit alpha [Alphaproteobacteria bacterium]
MLLKNFWYIAALRNEISAKPMRRILLGRPVVIWRDGSGKARALEDRCLHRQVPLSMGQTTDTGEIECPYHGIRYNGEGRCTFIPEQTRVPATAKLPAYTIVEKGEWAWLWAGQPEKADPSLIPAYPWFERSGWKSRTGYLHVKCNYKLIVDNLLNMAHLPYVHPRTIGNAGDLEGATMKVTRNGTNVRLARKVYNVEPPPTYKKAGGFTGNVNRWQTIDWIAPSNFEFHTGVVETGHEPPSPEYDAPKINARILDRHQMHGIAPETESSSHYYVGFVYDPAEINEDLADFIFGQTFATFKEDVVILEAQQTNMEMMPGEKQLDIVSDSAGLNALKVLDELEAAQA